MAFTKAGLRCRVNAASFGMNDSSFKSRVRAQVRKSGGAVRVARVVRALRHRIAYSRVADIGLEVLRHISPPSARLGPPKGTFLAYELLRRHEVSGEILRERQGIAPIPPDAMRVASGLNQHEHQPWPIFWTQHPNARLAGPTLVLMDERKHACMEAMYVEHHPRDPAFRSIWLPAPVSLAGNWTSIISRWTMTANFYHWFTDALPRLALLGRLPADTRILLPMNLQPFQLDTLRWMGLEERYRETAERHLMVETYFFSTPTAMTGCTNPYAVRFLRDGFLAHADESFRGPSKIYVLRRGKARGVINENEVVAFVSARGWTAVDPESLPLSQQIQLFSGARAICGVHGAGLTNILWCSPGCIIIELMADNYQNGCFESISACLDVRHNYLVFPGDDESRIRVELDRLAHVLPE
jgi:capsular polysaccharide biosynthesis protein